MEAYKLLLASVVILGVQKTLCSEESPLDENKLKIFSSTGSGETNSEVDHSKIQVKNHGEAVEYRFPKEVAVGEVKYDDVQVCELDSSFNPNALYLMLKRRAIVLVSGDIWRFYIKNENGWQFDGQKTMESMELDIGNNETTGDVSYSVSDGTALFRPLSDKFFRTVKQGSDTIFETEDSIEYARKVTLEGVNSHDQTLLVELLCGEIKTFIRQDGGSWELQEDKKPSEEKDSKLRGGCLKFKKTTGFLDFDIITIVLIIAGGILLLVLLGVLIRICLK
ncbi:conserved hypothetical protein [Theileria orientalis strain Shintoku]|uniref:Uncharacterized protein n=1 Tax=Theileria orientalis strain Shintoku TaxID=869250 RepID=J4CCB1_THEOR|nr:conserved hypothetical protein [Theileria orientalis strain Shintoku]PVC52911.1 hypothetical protein MACL_00000432 [Theileria orientalis]BAM39082.1 conserved hypothetical protein [Theileria orientalis strain Shintoku]|eukprot:XP_009689383.1 conserved hypothetical protein [Theileria orientalis strain Shintoku]